ARGPAWLACRRNSLRARLARPHPPGAGSVGCRSLATRSPGPSRLTATTTRHEGPPARPPWHVREESELAGAVTNPRYLGRARDSSSAITSFAVETQPNLWAKFLNTAA